MKSDEKGKVTDLNLYIPQSKTTEELLQKRKEKRKKQREKLRNKVQELLKNKPEMPEKH